MTMAGNVKRYLDKAGVKYDTVTHPRTLTSSRSAQAAHIPGDRVTKSVLIHHELGYVLIVVPSTHRVELGSVQDFLGRRLGLATEQEVSEVFEDCDIGAVPPIGRPYDVEVVVDESLNDTDDVYFEGGDHRTLVHVSRDGFGKLMQDARWGHFSHHA